MMTRRGFVTLVLPFLALLVGVLVGYSLTADAANPQLPPCPICHKAVIMGSDETICLHGHCREQYADAVISCRGPAPEAMSPEEEVALRGN